MKKILIVVILLINNVYGQTRWQQPGKSKSRLDSIEYANNQSVKASGADITRAIVSLTDSTFDLYANIRKDHRFFGYSNPSVGSEKLILFSVFTDDVENNPFNCKLGAYYDTRGLSLKYLSTISNFIKVSFNNKEAKKVIVYFEKKWVKFEK